MIKEGRSMDNITNEQLTQAGNEWLKIQFITGIEHFTKLFSEVSTLDYLTLLLLRNEHGIHYDKVYLKDIASNQELPMSQVSKRVHRLQDKGYVTWMHDTQGSYIILSKRGDEAMKRQELKVDAFMKKVIETFGYDRFMTMLDLRKELHVVMDNLLEQEICS